MESLRKNTAVQRCPSRQRSSFLTRNGKHTDGSHVDITQPKFCKRQPSNSGLCSFLVSFFLFTTLRPSSHGRTCLSLLFSRIGHGINGSAAKFRPGSPQSAGSVHLQRHDPTQSCTHIDLPVFTSNRLTYLSSGDIPTEQGVLQEPSMHPRPCDYHRELARAGGQWLYFLL